MKDFKETKDSRVTFPPRTVIFKENDFSKDIYIIKKGRVKLYKSIGKKNILLTQVENNGIIGELSIIDNGPRSATAITIDETEAVKITPTEFKETLKIIPDWFLSIARVLAQRLRLTDSKLGLSGPTVNEANVTAILIYLFSGVQENSGLVLQEAENTLTELLHIPGNELDAAFETLQKKKLILVNQGKITTDSIANLEGNLEKLRQSFSSSCII